MIQKIIILSISVAIIAAQTCSDIGIGPCPGGNCPTNHTCVAGGTLCCANAKVVACADKLNPKTGKSDCPNMASYCTNSLYRDLMTKECPLTCGFCKAPCKDKVGPNGVSDCTKMASYCNNSQYYALMTTECPVTCGRCPK